MKSKRFMALLLGCAMLLVGCSAPVENKETSTVQESPDSAQKADENADAPVPTSDMKIGVVLTTSGKGDKSYNDAVLLGLDKVKSELGVDYKDIQPKDVADFEKSIEFLAKEKYDVIISIGFTSAGALQTVAEKYPDTNFIIIDYNYGEEILPNVRSIVFKEEEGSYLGGVLAASMTKTNIIGFVGGMESPSIQKFEVGYKAGALSVNPDIEILISYVSADASGFNNPSRAKEIALDMINKKADIVYQAAGGSGIGVLDAAAEGGITAIGVDSNQNWIEPGSVISSVLKRVDTTVFESVKLAMDGKLETGVVDINGLAKDGVGLTDLRELTIEETTDVSPEDQAKIKALKDSIPDEVIAKIETAKQDIISGKIVVPSSR